MNEDATVVEVSRNPKGARSELERLCDDGLVADLILQDGTITSGVLLGISSTSLILDRWDENRHRPAGDPIVIAFSEVTRVVVP
jgi:hypothetical protein